MLIGNAIEQELINVYTYSKLLITLLFVYKIKILILRTIVKTFCEREYKNDWNVIVENLRTCDVTEIRLS